MKRNYLHKGIAVSLASTVLLMSQPLAVLADGATASSGFATVTSEAQPFHDGSYYYATVNLPYADFYYGELQTVTPSLSVSLSTPDPVTFYRSAGQYDAVSSATTMKSTKFPTTYYETTEQGVDILGLKEVQIAIPVALYQDIIANLGKEKDCQNKLYEFYHSMTFSDTPFAEYKILSGDGTFTAMTTSDAAGYSAYTTASDAAATITTDSTWGNYQISINGINVDSSSMLGVLLTTSDGSVYGMEHLENLWLKTGELSFCVEEFTEVHGNKVDYLRHESLPGKTITEIRYLIKNEADVVIPVSLPVKKLLSDNEYSSITVADVKRDTNGMTTSYINGLAGSKSYDGTLSSIAYDGESIDSSLYQYNAAKHTITLNGSLKPGAYTAIFSDDLYEDVKATFHVTSALKASDVNIHNNTLSVTGSDATLSEYIAAITGVKVNGTSINGTDLGVTVFKEDGSINFDASVNFHGTDQVLFPNGTTTDYALTIDAAGYPSVEAVVGKSGVRIPLTGIALNSSSLTLTKGKTATLATSLTPGNTTDATTITYTSSNPKVASVSSTGIVTATGCGTAVITATAGSHSATCKVTVSHTYGKETVLSAATLNKDGSLGKVCSSCKDTVTTATIYRISSVNLATTTYTYNGKNRTPNVVVKDRKGNVISSKYYKVTYSSKRSAIGVHTVKITFKGNYSGTVTKTFTIAPAKPALTLASPSKNSVTVKWKKDKSLSGYQISYATSSKFTKAKVIKVSGSASSKKLTKLTKNKKYYVKMRSYKTVKVNGKSKTIYSSWSSVKTVKTKK